MRTILQEEDAGRAVEGERRVRIIQYGGNEMIEKKIKIEMNEINGFTGIYENKEYEITIIANDKGFTEPFRSIPFSRMDPTTWTEYNATLFGCASSELFTTYVFNQYIDCKSMAVPLKYIQILLHTFIYYPYLQPNLLHQYQTHLDKMNDKLRTKMKELGNPKNLEFNIFYQFNVLELGGSDIMSEKYKYMLPVLDKLHELGKDITKQSLQKNDGKKQKTNFFDKVKSAVGIISKEESEAIVNKLNEDRVKVWKYYYNELPIHLFYHSIHHLFPSFIDKKLLKFEQGIIGSSQFEMIFSLIAQLNKQVELILKNINYSLQYVFQLTKHANHFGIETHFIDLLAHTICAIELIMNLFDKYLLYPEPDPCDPVFSFTHLKQLYIFIGDLFNEKRGNENINQLKIQGIYLFLFEHANSPFTDAIYYFVQQKQFNKEAMKSIMNKFIHNTSNQPTTNLEIVKINQLMDAIIDFIIQTQSAASKQANGQPAGGDEEEDGQGNNVDNKIIAFIDKIKKEFMMDGSIVNENQAMYDHMHELITIYRKYPNHSSIKDTGEFLSVLYELLQEVLLSSPVHFKKQSLTSFLDCLINWNELNFIEFILKLCELHEFILSKQTLIQLKEFIISPLNVPFIEIIIHIIQDCLQSPNAITNLNDAEIQMDDGSGTNIMKLHSFSKELNRLQVIYKEEHTVYDIISLLNDVFSIKVEDIYNVNELYATILSDQMINQKIKGQSNNVNE